MATVSKLNFIFINYYFPSNVNLVEDLNKYINCVFKSDFSKIGSRKVELTLRTKQYNPKTS